MTSVFSRTGPKILSNKHRIVKFVTSILLSLPCVTLTNLSFEHTFMMSFPIGFKSAFLKGTVLGDTVSVSALYLKKRKKVLNKYFKKRKII